LWANTTGDAVSRSVTPRMSTVQKIIEHKARLLSLAEEVGNVSRACKVMGNCRGTFYRYKQAVDEGGVEVLIDKSRRKPNLRNRTASEIEEAIVALAIKRASSTSSISSGKNAGK